MSIQYLKSNPHLLNYLGENLAYLYEEGLNNDNYEIVYDNRISERIYLKKHYPLTQNFFLFVEYENQLTLNKCASLIEQDSITVAFQKNKDLVWKRYIGKTITEEDEYYLEVQTEVLQRFKFVKKNISGLLEMYLDNLGDVRFEYVNGQNNLISLHYNYTSMIIELSSKGISYINMNNTVFLKLLPEDTPAPYDLRVSNEQTYLESMAMPIEFKKYVKEMESIGDYKRPLYLQTKGFLIESALFEKGLNEGVISYIINNSTKRTIIEYLHDYTNNPSQPFDNYIIRELNLDYSENKWVEGLSYVKKNVKIKENGVVTYQAINPDLYNKYQEMSYKSIKKFVQKLYDVILDNDTEFYEESLTIPSTRRILLVNEKLSKDTVELTMKLDSDALLTIGMAKIGNEIVHFEYRMSELNEEETKVLIEGDFYNV